MLLIFIGVYLVLAVLVYLMFKVLKGSVDKIGDQSKSYYVDKLQEYDELINDKEEKLNTLNREIKNKKVEAQSIKNDMLNNPIDFDISIIDVLSRTKYKDKSVFEIEQMIDEEFDYDKEKIIEEFVKRADDSKNFDFCKKLSKKFTPKRIYDLKTLSKDELNVKLKKILDEEEYKIFELYRQTHEKCSLDGFINYLDELVELNDPTITVYVGNKNEKYDYLDKNIVTKVDKNIFRGIKIGYRGKIYDFSLNGRNL